METGNPMDAEKRKAAKPRRRPRRPVGFWQRITNSPFAYSLYATFFATYLKLVRATSSVTFEPDRPEAVVRGLTPFIVTMWHGQNFMMPFARPAGAPVDILVSRHRDGEVVARALKQLGCGTVRGSGARKRLTAAEKGGISGFLAMRSRLEQGISVGLTADFMADKARQASLGVVMLARASGCPIVPAAFATSRRRELKIWDRSTINFPFSRAACVFGAPVKVPADADDAMLEAKRLEVERALNWATDRAYAIVDRRHG
jgi:lysophospholipid acyltransferase (LPLAT)-like uncharacterized protein